MGIDASAVASGTGITTTFRDLAGGNARSLPQRIALIGQGNEGASYSLDKFLITAGANEVGMKYGYQSPLYIMAREMFPSNGDGVGTIPVEVLPLDPGAGATPAVGAVIPSGSTTTAATYWLKIAGELSQPFVVPKGNVDASLIIGRMRAAVNNKLGLAMTADATYGTLVATPDGGNTGDGTVTALAVTAGGVPIPGDWSLVCTLGGAAAEFSLIDPEGVTVATQLVAGALVDPGASGLDFTLTYGAGDFVIGDSFVLDVAATDLTLTSGWNASNANAISLSVQGPDPSVGAVFAVTAPAGGAGAADFASGLAQIGTAWTTMIVMGTAIGDTAALDDAEAWGEGRWGTLVHKPAVAFVGSSESLPSTAIAITSLRTGDRVNSQVLAPGSANIHFQIAAAQVNRIARVANNNPPHDYVGQAVPTLEPGTDAEQWDYAQRNTVQLGGSSTAEKVDGKVTIADTVTMYRPIGEEPPAYSYVCDVVKLQNVLFNIDLEFSGSAWAGAPLIPSGQATTNSEAKTPEMAAGALASILDGLGLAAIISDPTRAKSTIVAGIDGANPKRLNIAVTVQIAGNTNIKSLDLDFGFFFGG